MIDVRLLGPALGSWLAAFVLVSTTGGAALGTAVLMVGLAAGTMRRRALRDALALTLVAAACTAAVVGVHLAAQEGGVVAGAAARGDPVHVVGRLRADPAVATSPWGAATARVRLHVTEVTAGPFASAVRQGVSVGVLVRGDGAWGDLTYASVVRASGTLVALPAGGTERYELRGASPPVVVEASPYGLADAMRAGLVAAVADRSAAARGLVPGVAVGDTSALPDDVADAMRATGLTHLTAVSGAHVAIIAGVLLGVGAVLRLPRAARALLVAVVLAGFVLLVRPDPSVQRAAVMGGIALLGLVLGRRAASVAALSTAVVVLVLLDPWLARSYGFVLSVVATGAIVLATPPAVRWLAQVVPRALAYAVVVPAVAQLACAPVLILLEPVLTPYAVLANVLVAPAVVPATIGGVLAAVVSPWCLPAAQVLVWTAAVATEWMASVATTLAAAPGAQIAWVPGAGGAVLLAGATLVGIAVVRWCVAPVPEASGT